MRRALDDTLEAARREPAFGLYLAAIAALGIKWGSPLRPLHEQALGADVLVAASAGAWLWHAARTRRWPRIRSFHVALGLYVAAVTLSMGFAADRGVAAVNGLLVLELCVLAYLTSQFTTNRRRLNAVVLVVAIVALYTAGLAVLGLGLFYAGLDSSLVGGYGALTPSDRYARVAAGFYSPALLSSFCIFASALVAHEDAEIPRRLRRAAQIALAGLVILTFSRAVIGFAAAIAIRAGFARRDSRGMRFATGAAVVVAVGLMVALTAGRLQIDPSRPTSISYAVPGQYNFRWHQVNDGLDSIAEHPLVGKGPGSLPSGFFGGPSRVQVRPLQSRVHVTPLQIAATMGLPALGAMVVLVATLWRNRRRPTPIATWSGLAGLAIDGLGHDIDHFRHVWIMLGLADAERRPDRSPRAAPDRETVRDRPSAGAR